MRISALLLLPTLAVYAACAAAGHEEPVFIDSFTERSTSVRCEPVPALTERRSAIHDVATVNDTSFLILYDKDREVAIVGPDLEPRHLITFDREGPAGVHTPSGAALLGDTLLYIADQTRMRLKIFDLQGNDRGSIELDFAPQRLQTVGGQLLITPFVIANHPRSLLFALDGDRARHLPIASARYTDGLVNVFANTANLATYPDGRIILTHTLIIPFAHVLTLNSPAPIRVPLPLPDGVRNRYGWLPTARITNADIPKLLFAAIASAPDQRTGEMVYLTKTGRGTDSGGEKALIRVDQELRFLRSYLLDVNAARMAYLAGQGISLVANSEDEWFKCHTP